MTAHQRTHDQLRLLEAAVAHQRDAVLITEAEPDTPVGRRIVFVNPAFTRITGFRAEEAIGRTPDITVGAASDPATIRRIRAAIEAKVPIREELLKYRKDGSPFWAEIDIAPVIDDDGRCTYFVCVLRDITDRKALHDRLLEADRLATMGALAAGLGHEINNPLSYVIGNLELLSTLFPGSPAGGGLWIDEADVADITSSVADAYQGAKRVREILRNLRAFARNETTTSGPVNLGHVLRTASKMVRNEVRHRANLVEDYPSSVLVRGNESRLGQAFVNLLVNAAQAIPNDGAAHEIGVRVTLGEETVEVEVRDSGAGVAAEDLPRLFDPFFISKRPGEGTGLGLSICKAIVSSVGGRISAESELGRGTSFRVVLPRWTERTPEAPTAPRPAPELVRGGKVLVIDDEEALVASMSRFLGQRHEVTAVTSGEEALSAIEQAGEAGFDVIICDIMMPLMSGMDLYEQVQGRWPGLEGRMVFTTGGAFTEVARAFLQRITNIRLEKPFERKALEAVVEHVMVKGTALAS